MKPDVGTSFKLAVLFNKEDVSPPSNLETLRFFQEVARKRNIEVDIIDNSMFQLLSNYDGLFLRSPADKDSTPYLFSCYMLQEGKPVIDDPLSVVQCTDKVYMQGLMGELGIPLPDSRGVTADTDLRTIVSELGLPLVIKLPDSYFSKGVFKVETYEALEEMTQRLFKIRGLLLAQEYVPTDFDWRIGVLEGQPLFACQYDMVDGHWQIVKHSPDGTFVEGSGRTIPYSQVPREVVFVAVEAAKAVGDGLYGVDLKVTHKGVLCIEVNDNPNIEHGIEDAEDDVWNRLLDWFKVRAIQNQGL